MKNCSTDGQAENLGRTYDWWEEFQEVLLLGDS